MASTSSGSGTTTVAVRSYQVIKIDGYSRSLLYSRARGRRPSFNSEPFRAGGWHVVYKPMGSPCRPENTDSISFSLVLDDDDDVVDAAMATFTLLGQNGQPVYAYSATARSVENNFSASRALGVERFIRRQDLERSKHLEDDRFAVRVHVHVIKLEEAPPSMVVPPPDIHRHLGDLLLSAGKEEGADVEFRVRGETFAAHRLLLGARSPVFRAMLFGPMKEGTTIQIEDMEVQVFGALLAFVYTDVWPETAMLVDDDQDEGIMAQHLLVAADRYGLPRLKLMCEERLQKHMGIGSVATILALAEQHQCDSLKKACFSFLGFSSIPFFLDDEEVIDGIEKLSRSSPTITKDLISGLLARDLERAILAEFCSRIPLFRGF